MSTPSILSTLKKIRKLLSREEKIKWIAIFGFAICTSALEVLTAAVIVVFANVLNKPEDGLKFLSKFGFISNVSQGKILFYLAISVGFIYFIKNTFATCEVFYQNISIQKMNYQFKRKILNHYAKMDYAFYLTRNSSQGFEVVNRDTEQMFTYGITSVAIILSESIIFFCIIAFMIYLNPKIALVIFVIGGFLTFLITKILLPKFYIFGEKIQEASLHSSQNLMQFFHAFKEIILSGKKEKFLNSFCNYAQKKSHVQALHTSVNTLPRTAIEVLFVGLFVITISIYSFNIDKENPEQIIGLLGGYLYGSFRIMPGLNRIISQLNQFKSTTKTIERVYGEYTSIEKKEKYLDISSFKFEKSICLKNISFKYINSNKNSIDNLCLEIKKGECIGIAGETGSGKSTLIDIILGLLKPYSGEILIDNKFQVNSYQWHKKIGYVPQSIYLTDDTIAANIAFGEKVIDQKNLNKAIDICQLRKFISLLPNGVKTIVGERGVRLSGGERQRIAIARAIYRNPEVLIFDEATSALDNETENNLMQTIYSISKNYTLIMIAHRLSTLKECSRIIFLENGKIKKISPNINY